MSRAVPREFERWVHFKTKNEYQIIGVVTPVNIKGMEEMPMFMPIPMLIGMGGMLKRGKAPRISVMDTTNGDIKREVIVMAGRYVVDKIPEDMEQNQRFPKLYILYQGLYGDHDFYMREVDEFMSKVDKEKYPECTKEYRFERKEQ